MFETQKEQVKNNIQTYATCMRHTHPTDVNGKREYWMKILGILEVLYIIDYSFHNEMEAYYNSFALQYYPELEIN